MLIWTNTKIWKGYNINLMRKSLLGWITFRDIVVKRIGSSRYCNNRRYFKYV